jgi:outer membrane lipase/esterase
VAVLGEAPLAVEQANWRTLDGRMISATNAPRGPGKLEAWIAYDYGAPDYSTSFGSGSGNVNTIAVGADIKMSDRLLAGVMFNYSENRSDYAGMSYKLREPMGTFYVGYGEGPWYLGGSLGGGNLDYGTTRNITLGALTRQETGDTNGWQFIGRIVGGYWFKAGGWIHGPTARLTFQEIRVRQFQENGSSSTTMTFGQQERTSLITTLGWQVSGELGSVRPFARAAWEYESRNDSRDITASVYGTGGSFNIPAYKPDNNWALFDLGVAADFGKVTGFLTGSATAGKGDGNYYGITVGLRLPL